MKRETAVAAVITSGLTIGSFTIRTHAQPVLSISDGFISSSWATWRTASSMHASPGTFLATGGNPGAYASLTVTSSSYERRSTGFTYDGRSNIVLRSWTTHLTFSADLRRTSTIVPGTPTPELVPIIILDGRLFQPARFIPAPTTDEWTTLAPVTFNLSEFTTASGFSLLNNAPIRVGFWWRFNPTPSLPAPVVFGVGVDNVTISLVPAPGTLAVLLAAVPLLTRRRR